MAKKQLPSRRVGAAPAALFRRIQAILEQARAQVARSVNTEMVRAYWLVGREIVEEEQRGRERAGYGEELITQLSDRLQKVSDRGLTPSDLRYMRLFYLAYPDLLGSEIRHAPRDESGEGAACTPERRKAGSTGRLQGPGLARRRYSHRFGPAVSLARRRRLGVRLPPGYRMISVGSIILHVLSCPLSGTVSLGLSGALQTPLGESLCSSRGGGTGATRLAFR